MARPTYDGPIIDLHVHLQADAYGPYEYHAATGRLRMYAYGALATGPHRELERTRERNDALLSLHDDRSTVLPFPAIHPADGDAALRELRRVAASGAVGVVLDGADAADPDALPLVRRAGELGLPVFLDAFGPADPPQPGRFLELALDAPDTQFVLGHAMGPRAVDLAFQPLLEKYSFWRRNIWLDLSSAAVVWADSPYADHFVWVCRQVGTDRLLFGSNFPLHGVVQSVDAVATLDFTANELAAIYYNNASALLY